MPSDSGSSRKEEKNKLESNIMKIIEVNAVENGYVKLNLVWVRIRFVFAEHRKFLILMKTNISSRVHNMALCSLAHI